MNAEVLNCKTSKIEIFDFDFSRLNIDWNFSGMDIDNFDDINSNEIIETFLFKAQELSLKKTGFKLLKQLHVKKIIYLYLKKLISLKVGKSVKDYRKCISSFRSFVSSVSGRHISNELAFELFSKKLKEINPLLEAKNFRKLFFEETNSCFHKREHLRNKNSRGWQPTDCKDFSEEQMLVGGVLVCCSILVGAISLAVPVAAPACSLVAGVLFTAGAELFAAGGKEKIWPQSEHRTRNYMYYRKILNSFKLTQNLKG